MGLAGGDATRLFERRTNVVSRLSSSSVQCRARSAANSGSEQMDFGNGGSGDGLEAVIRALRRPSVAWLGLGSFISPRARHRRRRRRHALNSGHEKQAGQAGSGAG